MFKQLTTVFAFGLFALSSKDAFAYFKICNQSSQTVWSTYSHFLASTNEQRQECSRQFGCPYSAWRVQGWWKIDPGQCATVLGSSITNRYSYVYAHTANGSTISGSNPFQVVTPAFVFEEQTKALPVPPGAQCLGQLVQDCQRTAYTLNFKKIDTGTSQNFVFNITN